MFNSSVCQYVKWVYSPSAVFTCIICIDIWLFSACIARKCIFWFWVKLWCFHPDFFSFRWRGMGFYIQWSKINDMHLSYANDKSHQLHMLNCLWNTAGASPTFCRLVHHARCTRMQGDMQCSLTCRRVCVQGTTTTVADPCVCCMHAFWRLFDDAEMACTCHH